MTTRKPAPKPPKPTSPETPPRQEAEPLAVTAGVADDVVKAKTGKPWAEWVAALDAEGATAMTHAAIAKHLGEAHSLSGWWAQTVTVGYERIRGLRARGQRRDGAEPGGFEASKSKTFAAPVSELYAELADAPRRHAWLGDVALEVRKATPERSMRIAWPDGSSVSLWFVDKGAKSQLSVQHGKLASREQVDEAKAFWGERLEALAARLAGAGRG